MTRPPFHIRSFAKINLALAVLGRRPDGYHDIQTLFQTIDLCDTLEFRESPEIRLQCPGLPEVPERDNLVWKAASRFAERFHITRGAAITLHKNIPAGAGLGGGSGNAAAVLLGLRRYWDVPATDSDLMEIASGLGSDVPFFIIAGTALGAGCGEVLTPLPDSSPEALVVVYPGIPVSTAEAYRSLNLGLTSTPFDHRIHRFCSLIQQGEKYTAEIFNDFETSILPAHPGIQEAKSFLESSGAVAVLLSGSGSSVFGFFPREESTHAVAQQYAGSAWRVFPAKTLSRAEYFQSMFG